MYWDVKLVHQPYESVPEFSMASGLGISSLSAVPRNSSNALTALFLKSGWKRSQPQAAQQVDRR